MVKERILIVEDDEETARIYKMYLEKYGYKADIVTKGKDAVGMLDKEKYSLVLLDLSLPDISGMEVLKILSDKYRDIDSIIMTGKGSDELRKKAIQLGAYDYINKPVSFSELNLLISHCLEKQRLLKST